MSMQAVHKDDIRHSAVAGAFYPGTRHELEQEVDYLLKTAPVVQVDGKIVALVVPHAGYRYSGQVAATGYRLLSTGDAEVVAIISPSHHDYFPGVSVFNGEAYETPLGPVSIASDVAEELIASHDLIESSWLGHRQEHALEVQLPFVQKRLPDARIVPIVIGLQDFHLCTLLGDALARVLAKRRAVVIATSDLSHFHSYDEAVAIDRVSCRLVESFDVAAFYGAVESKTCEACGAGPIMAAMVASKKLGANQAKVLVYRNSGDASGEFASVVGYLSAAFYRAK